MNRKRLSRYAVRLFFAATTFALGLASSELWRPAPDSPPPARYVAPPPTPPVLGVCAPAQDTNRDEEETQVKGRYYDYDYGFSVDLPKGMFGVFGSHDFGIDLDNPQSVTWAKSGGFPKSYIYVGASPNSLEWSSLDEAAKQYLSYIETDPGSKVTLLRRSATKLAGLRAARFVARYMKGGEAMVTDQIIAFRGEGGYAVYTIGLDTPEANYERDKAVVAEMQKTWCLQPLP